MVVLTAATFVVVITVDSATEWLGPVRYIIHSTQSERFLIICTVRIAFVAIRDLASEQGWLRQNWMVRLGEASYAF